MVAEVGLSVFALLGGARPGLLASGGLGRG